MDLNLAGRSVLITGASKGIGAAAARAFAAEGCGAIHLAARDQAALTARAAELQRDFGAKVSVHALDLAKPASQRALAAAAGEIDILVNNAGAIPRGTLLEIDEARWRDAWDLKVFGYINLTREIYRMMSARRRGVIVNVVGMAGERPDATYIAAGSGNAALIYFTEALGGASLKDGVRVLGVNPGPVLTDRYIGGAERRAQARFGDSSRWRELLTTLPLGRPAEPEEVASLVAYLASDQASYLSGVLVRIDGGLKVCPPAN
jgi:hypothetical protein